MLINFRQLHLSLKIILITIAGLVFFFSLFYRLSKWDKNKAEYLARRVLLAPTREDVNRLAAAGSAEQAVNLILASPPHKDVEKYQEGLRRITEEINKFDKNDIGSDSASLNSLYYTYQLIHDPDRARRKLYYLWENTFSFDVGSRGTKIAYPDAQKVDQMLYENTYGDYMAMVKYVGESFPMVAYLDLDKSKKDDPNQNFARELMQLFLIGPYTPLDKKYTKPNYTEDDVKSLSYIETGVNTNMKTKSTFFVEKEHYPDQVNFLGEKFNDPKGIVDYIVKKKKTEASQFLATKIMKYYLGSNPDTEDIKAFAKVIYQNDFVILPSIKWFLSSDIMYKKKYMEQNWYNTPLDLVANYYGYLYGRDNYNVLPSSEVLKNLNFEPYKPGSVFGRDGFNDNARFYSGSVINRWIASADSLVQKEKNPHFLDEIAKQNPDSARALVHLLEQKFYLTKSLPSDTVDRLVKYLNENDLIKFRKFSINSIQQKTRILDVVGFMLSQPEFLLQTGNTQEVMMGKTFSTEDKSGLPKLIIVRLKGGFDYIGLVANLNDTDYAKNRKDIAITPQDSFPLGSGYVFNKIGRSLLPLIKSKNAFFVSAVSLPGKAHAHDIASIQEETGLLDYGILANLVKNLPEIKPISLSFEPPIMMRGVSTLQIGPTSLVFYPMTMPNADLGQVTRAEKKRETIDQILHSRLLPGEVSTQYNQALFLDRMAVNNIKNGEKDTPGDINKDQFKFIEGLISKNVGNVYYMYGDNDYDNHAGGHASYMYNVKNLADNILNIFNDEKDKTKICIVVFSEFGRSNKVNGTGGTDHGDGGGMIVVSNFLKWPTMVGSIDSRKNKDNWIDLQIDSRDVWSSVFKDAYGLPLTKLFGRDKYITSYPITLQ